jgi:hypothetical protein
MEFIAASGLDVFMFSVNLLPLSHFLLRIFFGVVKAVKDVQVLDIRVNKGECLLFLNGIL